jgi:predicted TIM-barrel fold metal-dependent hydrolase
MIDDAFVIDAVVHGYNLSPENQRSPAAAELAAALYYGVHRGFSPRGQEQWILDEHRFLYGHNPDQLAHALFAESQTDVGIYHGVPAYGLFTDGGSPLWVGKEIRQRYPGRMLLYGPISPFQPGAVEEVDRLVEEEDVVGIKLYPLDIIDGEIKTWHADDPELIYPILERAQARGIRSIAIHKAIPFGRVPSDPFRPTDIEGAAAAFPNLTFEVVHGGFAYLEETAMMVARFPNVAINLEGGSGYLVNSPRKFAEIIGTFMFWGGADRLIWATGCIALHPRPFVEAFWRLKMPKDLMDDYGFPPLTPEVKRAALSGNIARILGLDLEAIKQTIACDEFAQKTKLAEPWSGAAVANMA